MKRKVLLTVLGVAGILGMAASSYGQGQIQFNTYVSTPYYPIVYGAGSGGLTGTGAGVNVSAELGYFIGTSSNPAQFTLLSTSITAVSSTASAPSNGTGPSLSGYIVGPALTIPGYVSGPVSFEILAWTTTGGTTYANAAYNNALTPYIWTEPSIPQGALANPGLFTALPGNIVLTPTPEPTTLALAGLGGLASLVAFRRKQA